MYDTDLIIEQNLTLLATAPTRLADLTNGCTPTHLLTPPEPGAWSARDILAHLRSCADIWGASIVKILHENEPTFKAVNPTTWIKQTNYHDLDFHPSLHAYTTQRAELVALLQPLPREDWSRTAMVTGSGKPRQRSVQTYAQWLAHHEQSHIKQIKRIITTLRRKQ